ncbi:MAG TPA: CBS domain-containing protein [Anaeromyxobacteraceae bacterium]
MTATARDLLAMKNSAVVYTCSPEASVEEACRALRDRRVGCLVVVREEEVQGLLSEREVAARVVAQGLDPAATRVREVMLREVATVTLETPCAEVEALLRERRVRHLPVLGARGLLGVVSLGDVARFYAARERSIAAGAPAPALQ